MITITIPGKPMAQAHHGSNSRVGNDGKVHTHRYDLPGPRDWKAAARAIAIDHLQALGKTMPVYPEGPVRLVIYALWALPKKHHRKRTPVTYRSYHTKKAGDMTNLVKAAEDAFKGVFWTDDCQVAVQDNSKWVGAQGESAFVEIKVGRPWDL